MRETKILKRVDGYKTKEYMPNMFRLDYKEKHAHKFTNFRLTGQLMILVKFYAYDY